MKIKFLPIITDYWQVALWIVSTNRIFEHIIHYIHCNDIIYVFFYMAAWYLLAYTFLIILLKFGDWITNCILGKLANNRIKSWTDTFYFISLLVSVI